MIVRRLLQHEVIVSRRALLRGLASVGSVLPLGGCVGLGATGARFDASLLSGDPTLLVATTRKRVNGGRAKPWFGPERASTMTVARAKLVPPDDGRLSLTAVGLGDPSFRRALAEPRPPPQHRSDPIRPMRGILGGHWTQFCGRECQAVISQRSISLEVDHACIID